MKIRKGDNAIIMKGKDRGKSGKVIKIYPAKGTLMIEGLNIKKKSSKPKKQGEKGQIISIPAPIKTSNVQILCPSCKKPTRIGFRVDKNTKERFCKKCNAIV